MKTSHLLIVVMFLFAYAVPVWADDEATYFDSIKNRAGQGEAEAQTLLGGMYSDGLGVPQDYAEALKWYNLAAAQGDDSAQFQLGYMYYKGLGVPRDYVQAYKWLNLAAAAFPIGYAAEMRDMVAARMTPAQIAEAQKLASEWKKQ